MKRTMYWALVVVALGACSGGGGGGSSDSRPADLVDGNTTVIIDAALPDAFSCTSPTVECSGQCIDPLLDREFCGATTCEDDATDGEQCDAGMVCSGGSCQTFVCEAVGGGGGNQCNPVTQAGCAVGEKCTQFIESASPFLARTTCVPDGSVPTGGDCILCGDDTGYDDCASGNTCVQGQCTEICATNPDSCRTPAEEFDEGFYCNRFANLFDDETGVCIPACHPTNDSVTAGVVTNADCGEGNGCYLSLNQGSASCTGVPTSAIDLTQNEVCDGPGQGCYLNGCASGFGANLPNAAINATNSVCSRFCTPVNTHIGAQAGAPGAGANCSDASLALVGGTNGAVGEHQCRFLNSFYSNTDELSDTIGMCVPVVSPGGGTWGDCKLLDWDGIKNAVAGAADMTAAFNAFCIDNGEYKPECRGLGSGCLSAAEIEEGLPGF